MDQPFIPCYSDQMPSPLRSGAREIVYGETKSPRGSNGLQQVPRVVRCDPASA